MNSDLSNLRNRVVPEPFSYPNEAMEIGNNSASSDADSVNSVSAAKSTTSVPSNTSLNARKSRALNAEERCKLTVSGIDIRFEAKALAALAYSLFEQSRNKQYLYNRILNALGFERSPPIGIHESIELMVEGLFVGKAVFFAALLIESHFKS